MSQELWQDLLSRIHYLNGDFMEANTYQRISAMLAELDEKYQTAGNCLFYLSTPPFLYPIIVKQLHRAGLNRQEQGWTRIIIEKPFGTNQFNDPWLQSID